MLWISVRNARQNTQLSHAAGPIELGRGPPRDVTRYVIEDAFVSRDQLRIEELPGRQAQVRNLSAKHPVTLADDKLIPASESQVLDLPVRITVGETLIEIKDNLDPEITVPAPADLIAKEGLAADGYSSIQPIHRSDQMDSIKSVCSLGETPSPQRLAQWMETVLALQRSDAGPAEFYAQTARAMIGMIGLDVGLVLLLRDKGWKAVARAAAEEADNGQPISTGREFSQTVLRQILAEKQTIYQDLGRMKAQESLQTVDAVAASPIFGLNEEVVGALYGLRRARGELRSCKIRPLEAQLLQLLAAAVGANLARVMATRTRTQFEQFFSPELVRELERDPGLLEGRAQDVTILMSDLRGFSTLSERLGPQETCRLVRDVMECLSERIVEQGGVIVSYLGDGILAMWNAPVPQKDHAARACRAALAMLEELPALNAVWEPVVGQPLRIGVGINTGPAQVGNTGSTRKFMYGPLGNTVNLASRVEGATKHFKVPVLVTGSTWAQLDNSFVTRRLCQVRVLGIQGVVDLYELRGESASPEWLASRDAYEAALALYESRQWLKTCQTLLPLLEQTQERGEHDNATLKLMKRSWACLEAPGEPFDPVLDLTSK
jgi:adenylate cyclase